MRKFIFEIIVGTLQMYAIAFLALVCLGKTLEIREKRRSQRAA